MSEPLPQSRNSIAFETEARFQKHAAQLLQNNIYRFLILLLLTLLLASCGRGGQARFELNPLSTDQALDLLERNAHDPEKSAAIVARVEAQRAPGFEFARFWQRLQDSKLVARLPESTQRQLLALHGQSCQETDFDAFARLVATLDRRHQNFIMGEFRRCQIGLTPERSLDFLLRLVLDYSPTERAQRLDARGNPLPNSPAQQVPIDPNLLEPWMSEFPADAKALSPEEQQTRISRFLVREIVRSPRQSWALVACYLNSDDLAIVARELKKREEGELARAIAEAQSDGCER